MSAATALSDTGNDRIRDGGNLDPFTAHQINITDLTEEAKVWLDGKAVESPEEAAALDTLLDMARKAAKAADDARTAEKKPHLDAGKAVDAKWKPLTDSATRIADLCKRVLTPWREKVEAERRAEADRIAAEAEAQRQREVEASRLAAQTGSLEDQERADQEAAAAQQAERAAKSAGKAASSSLGLRTVRSLKITDPGALARWLWTHRRDESEAAHAELAQRIFRGGGPAMAGTEIEETKKAV